MPARPATAPAMSAESAGATSTVTHRPPAEPLDRVHSVAVAATAPAISGLAATVRRTGSVQALAPTAWEPNRWTPYSAPTRITNTATATRAARGGTRRTRL